MTKSTRTTDELVLDMIAARCAGQSCRQIADLHGVSREYVLTATNRVKKDDMKFSYDPSDEVAGAYWL